MYDVRKHPRACTKAREGQKACSTLLHVTFSPRDRVSTEPGTRQAASRPPRCWDYSHTHTPDILHRCWDLNSDLHAHTERTLAHNTVSLTPVNVIVFLSSTWGYQWDKGSTTCLSCFMGEDMQKSVAVSFNSTARVGEGKAPVSAQCILISIL